MPCFERQRDNSEKLQAASVFVKWKNGKRDETIVLYDLSKINARCYRQMHSPEMVR